MLGYEYTTREALVLPTYCLLWPLPSMLDSLRQSHVAQENRYRKKEANTLPHPSLRCLKFELTQLVLSPLWTSPSSL